MPQLQIRVPQDIINKLDEEAKRRDLDRSDVAREKLKKGMGLPI